MGLKLMYITNRKDVAQVAEDNGVEWVFIDLECNGKIDRQGHLDSVISRHDIEDVNKIKKVLKKSELLVRINPIYEGSENEINRVINDGADIIMLPFFKTYDEVKTFIKYVAGRAKTCLLCETKEAVENIDDILTLDGIDMIHIGLNDLHLAYNMKFMFQVLSNGTVEMLCNKFKEKGIPYGFGGIARLGQGVLSAEHVIAEHYRLGSTMVILSRSFCNTDKMDDIEEIRQVFQNGLREIRAFERELYNKNHEYFEENKKTLADLVNKITINQVMP